MKCGWRTIPCPFKGQRQYQAFIGLSQTARLTGGFDFLYLPIAKSRP